MSSRAASLNAGVATASVRHRQSPRLSQVSVYDALGRVTATRQPISLGGDAGETRTVYYTADASAADSRCDGKPEWAGLVCLVGPAAAATTSGTPANGPATMPTTLSTGYDVWLGPVLTEESSGPTLGSWTRGVITRRSAA